MGFFKKSNVNTEQPKNIKEAFIIESGRHLKLKKWTDGVKAGAIALLAVVSIVFTLSDTTASSDGPHVAVINLSGVIETGSPTDGWKVSRLITDAIENEDVKVIVIEANSAGGSPTDAEHIYKTIMSYRNQKGAKPIYVAIRGICASACYYIASSADEVYALNSSLIGSIGVKMESWDLQSITEKLGIKRRSYHAGQYKTLLDPFKPVSEEGREFIQDQLLVKLHKQFIHAVKDGRGTRISDDPLVYSGLIWTGEESLELGLVDGITTPTEMESMIDIRHGVSKFIYHGQKKFKLSNIFSMTHQEVADSFFPYFYHGFKKAIIDSESNFHID